MSWKMAETEVPTHERVIFSLTYRKLTWTTPATAPTQRVGIEDEVSALWRVGSEGRSAPGPDEFLAPSF